MEIILHNTINDYLNDNNLFSGAQQDLRNKYLTVSSLLLSQYNYVNCIEGKKILMLFYLIFVKHLMP